MQQFARTTALVRAALPYPASLRNALPRREEEGDMSVVFVDAAGVVVVSDGVC